MATINGNTASSYWTFKLEVTENSIDAINNTSSITVSAHIGRKSTSGSSYMQGAKIPCTINISSNEYNDSASFTYNNSNRVDIAAGGWIKIGSVTFSSVKHNSDGLGTITISASFTNNISPASGSANGTFKLTDIARASSVSMSGGNIGSEATITITPTDPSYFYTLKYSFYGKSGTCADINGSPASLIDYTSFKWLIPLNLAEEISDSTYGTGSLTCITYNSDKKTIVGEKTISIRLEFLKQPTVDGYDVEIVDDKWQLCLAGHSSVRVKASVSAYNGATIKSCNVSIGGHGTFSANVIDNTVDYTSDVLTSVGTKNIKISVTDSRGVTSGFVGVGAVEVIGYVEPSVKTFTASRKDDNKSQVVVKCNWDFDSVKGNNAAIGEVYYKEGKNGTYNTNPISVTKGSEILLDGIEFDATKSYYFKLIVTDGVGETDVREAFISTREVLMDFRAGGKGLSIGKISEADIFEVAMESKFKQEVIEEYGHYVHVTDAGIGNKGYIRIAQMTVEAAWNDAYMIFEVVQRHQTFSRYYVSFKHTSDTDPEIDTFTYDGDMPGYLVKVEAGKWDLIVKKTEGNDVVCVVDFKNNPYTKGKTNIEWLDDGYIDILPSNALISGKRSNTKSTLLWTGAAYMHGTQTANLNYLISSQERGIVLVFSQWDYSKESNPSEALKNDNFVSCFVPKEMVAAFPGNGHTFQLVASNYSAIATKYLKIYDDRIEGDPSNVSKGNIGTSDVLYNNNAYVLVRIYGV